MKTEMYKAIVFICMCHVLPVFSHTKTKTLRDISHRPKPPKVVQVLRETNDTIRLNITAPSGGHITRYQIYYPTYSNSVDANQTSLSTFVTINEDLVPGSAYAINVWSFRQDVKSENFTETIGHTLPNPPSNVTVIDRRTNSIVLEVQPGTGNHDRFCAIYSNILHPGTSLNVSERSVLLPIPDLMPGDSYNISVFTISNQIWSSTFYGMVISTLPSPPSSVSLKHKTATCLSVSIEPGEGIHDGFRIVYSSASTPPQHINITTEGSEDLDITGLQPGTLYNFTIFTLSNNLQSSGVNVTEYIPWTGTSDPLVSSPETSLDRQFMTSTPNNIHQNVTEEDETLREICNIPGYISGPDTVLEGSSIRFLAIFSVNLSCVSSSVQHEIDWYIGNINTKTDSSKIQIKSNYSQEEMPWSFLTFQDVSALDARPLRACYMRHCYTKSAINVQPLLRARIDPGLVSVEVRGKTSFSCIVSEYKLFGDLEFKWTFSGSEESHDSELHGFPSTTDGVSVLHLQNITQQYTGTYTCSVMSFIANMTMNTSISSFLHVFTKDAETCPKTSDKNGLVWNKTPIGQKLSRFCPDGFEGSATRVCNQGGLWGETNLINCVNKDIDNALNQINGIKDGVVDPSEIHNVLDSLANITTTSNVYSTKLSSGDLNTGLAVLSSSIDVIAESQVSPNVTHSFVQVIDNMLSPNNHETWTEVNKESSSTDASNLMKTIEKLGSVVGKKISKGEQITIGANNIAIEIKRVQSNDLYFRPNISSSHTNFQNEIALNLGGGQTTDDVTFIGAMYATIANILPEKNESIGYPSEVLALSIINGHSVQDKLPSNVSMKFDTYSLRSENNLTGSVNIKCVFWNFNETAGAVGWSDYGCAWSAEKKTCLCNHLTNFAVLMSPIEITNELDIARLRVITLAGCSLSIFSTVVTMLVYMMLWRYVKNDRSVLVMNLCVAVTAGYILFLAGLDQIDDNVECTVIAALLHFLFLAMFCLMLSDGIQLLRRTTVVLNVKSILKWLLLLGWGVPAIIVGITVGVKYNGEYHSKKYCWLTLKDGVLYSFVGPVLAVIVINVIVIILVLKALLTSKFIMTKSQRQRLVSAIRSVCVLLPVLGITWFFGILSVNDDLLAFQYLFAVTNSLQGFFIFLFHCVFSVPIRRAMKQKYKKFESTSKSDKSQGAVTRSSKISGDDVIDEPYRRGKIDRLSVSHTSLHNTKLSNCNGDFDIRL